MLNGPLEKGFPGPDLIEINGYLILVYINTRW